HYCLTDVCRTVLHPFPTRRASDLGARVPVTSPSSVLGVSHSGQHLTGRRASRPALQYADSGIGPVRGLSLCLMSLGLSERGSTLRHVGLSQWPRMRTTATAATLKPNYCAIAPHTGRSAARPSDHDHVHPYPRYGRVRRPQTPQESPRDRPHH